MPAKARSLGFTGQREAAIIAGAAKRAAAVFSLPCREEG